MGLLGWSGFQNLKNLVGEKLYLSIILLRILKNYEGGLAYFHNIKGYCIFFVCGTSVDSLCDFLFQLQLNTLFLILCIFKIKQSC